MHKTLIYLTIYLSASVSAYLSIYLFFFCIFIYILLSLYISVSRHLQPSCVYFLSNLSYYHKRPILNYGIYTTYVTSVHIFDRAQDRKSTKNGHTKLVNKYCEINKTSVKLRAFVIAFGLGNVLYL